MNDRNDRDEMGDRDEMDELSDANAEGVPAAKGGVLQGIRVLDLSRVLAGPYCGQLLGDFGATVYKVESPAGDDTRTWGPPFFPDGKSAYFTSINRNKQNVCLDLSQPAGVEVLREMLGQADVVIENFKTGTMARWGLDYHDVIAPAYPELVYCRITGYGTTGPMGGLPGYDAVLQGYAGLMSINGEPDGEPVRIGVPIVDLVTGLLAFSGILLALQERTRSGRGQLVDCALLDAAIAMLHPHSTNFLASGEPPVRTGSAHPTIAPYESFRVGEKQFFIAAANDRQFQALARVLGRPELTSDPRFATNASRVENVAALRAILTELLAPWELSDLGPALLEIGVPATEVNDVRSALASPQVAHRELVVQRGEYRAAGVPIKLERTPGEVASVPRLNGEDSLEALTGLGLHPARIRQLIEDGVVRIP